MALMARVLLDGTKLLDPRTDGVKRYVGELVCALAQSDQRGIDIDVAVTAHHVVPLSQLALECDHPGGPLPTVPRLLSPGDDNPIVAGKRMLDSNTLGGWSRAQQLVQLQAWRLVRSGYRRWARLRWQLTSRQAPYDLVHLALPNTWKHFAQVRGRLVTTVHDLSHLVCPEFQTRSNNRSLRDGMAFAQRRRSRYLAVSSATAHSLERLLQIPQSRIDVVHHGVDGQRFTPTPAAEAVARVREKYRIPSKPFVLCLSTIEPRKNLTTVVRAFNQVCHPASSAPFELVIAGRPGWGNQHELSELISQNRNVRTVGYVDELDLPIIYSIATSFCYASLHEGFGLPLIEAMSCGAPVIYGNNSSMPEAAAGGGIGVDARRSTSIAAAMKTLLTDEPLRRRLANDARKRASQFQWTKTARSTIAAYVDCLHADTGGGRDSQQEAPRARAA